MHLTRSTRTRAWLISLAVTALVLMQSLGLMHGVLHVPGGQGTHVAQRLQPGDAPHGVSALFTGHVNGDDRCQLYDQLAHADMASLPVLALPSEFAEAPRTVDVLVLLAAAQPLGFQARGPPAFA
jgi:hypothetical protein